jgi:hypothetical protein
MNWVTLGYTTIIHNRTIQLQSCHQLSTITQDLKQIPIYKEIKFTKRFINRSTNHYSIILNYTEDRRSFNCQLNSIPRAY